MYAAQGEATQPRERALQGRSERGRLSGYADPLREDARLTQSTCAGRALCRGSRRSGILNAKPTGGLVHASNRRRGPRKERMMNPPSQETRERVGVVICCKRREAEQRNLVTLVHDRPEPAQRSPPSKGTRKGERGGLGREEDKVTGLKGAHRGRNDHDMPLYDSVLIDRGTPPG